MRGTKRANLCFLPALLLGAFFRSCDGERVFQLTSALATGVCGQVERYEESKEIQPSLRRVPLNIPLISNCDRWFISRACSKADDKKCEEVEHEVCNDKGRVLGGEAASAAEFPWDVSIRMIYDWGKFWPEPRDAESIATNDFEGLKESHRCTGTLYSKRYILTSAWCAYRAQEYLKEKNRFVAWIARGRFLDAKHIEANNGKKKLGDVFVHPDFDPTPSTNSKKDHDIGIIDVESPFTFSKDVYAIEIAAESRSFAGANATFAGWGTTVKDKTGSMLGNADNKEAFGTKLYKLNLIVMEFPGKCENVIRKALEASDNYDPDEDLSKRYMCARAEDPKTQGTCGGDIGGPLICTDETDKKKKFLCGIKNGWSIIKECPTPEGVEIFMRPSFYMPWIEGIAGKQEADDFSFKAGKKATAKAG